MLRRHRGILAAIAGLILLGVSPAPERSAEPEKQQAAPNAKQPEVKRPEVKQPVPRVAARATEPAQPVQPPEYYRPCGQKGSLGKSDLCAQWNAAEAARDAADWAWWQMWFSAAGVAGLVITLFFNFRALNLAERESEETKSALKIAEENAKAAVDLAKISREATENDLRAWLPFSAKLVEIRRTDQAAHFSVEITFRNVGRTPALAVSIETTCRCGPSQIILLPDNDLLPPKRGGSPMPSLMPGTEHSQRFGVTLRNEEIAIGRAATEITPATLMVTIGIIIYYRTVFDQREDVRATSAEYSVFPREFAGTRLERFQWLDADNRNLDTDGVRFSQIMSARVHMT